MIGTWRLSLPAKFVTVTVIVWFPAAVAGGVPVSSPVCGFIVSPVGRPVAVQVSGWA